MSSFHTKPIYPKQQNIGTVLWATVNTVWLVQHNTPNIFMKKALEVQIFYLLIIQLNHSTSRIQRTSLLVLLGVFFARNVTPWSMWGRSAYQTTMNATKCVCLEFRVQNWVCELCVTSNSRRKRQKRWNRAKGGPNDHIYPYLEVYSHKQLVSPSVEP